jgi:hypothetical protein
MEQLRNDRNGGEAGTSVKSKKRGYAAFPRPALPCHVDWLLLRRLGFAKTGDAFAGLPLAAILEDCDPLKPFQDVAFATGGGGGAEAAVLGHKWCCVLR